MASQRSKRIVHMALHKYVIQEHTSTDSDEGVSNPSSEFRPSINSSDSSESFCSNNPHRLASLSPEISSLEPIVTTAEQFEREICGSEFCSNTQNQSGETYTNLEDIETDNLAFSSNFTITLGTTGNQTTSLVAIEEHAEPEVQDSALRNKSSTQIQPEKTFINLENVRIIEKTSDPGTSCTSVSDSLIISDNTDNSGSSSELAKRASNKQLINCRIRRKHRCLYCDQDVSNYIRHLERNHADELAVQELMNLEKNSKKRKKYADKLRREGDFCTSNVIPVMSLKQKQSSEYIVCKFCRGYYSRKSLRRHAKKCYFNPDPANRFNAQAEGQTVMVGHFGPNDPLRTSGLLNMMRADNISLVAKKDVIICEIARRYIKSHKDKHLLAVAKRYMRRLARLLIEVREIEKNHSLQLLDILTPIRFKTLVSATRKMAKYENETQTFSSPSLALQMGTLIKNAISTAYSKQIQNENSSKEQLEKLNTLTKLIEADWAHEVSSEAGQNLALNRFNKPTQIPVAEDIMKFETYLKNLTRESKRKLVDDSKDMRAFRDLQDGVFCSVMIFNKRRVGELQRMSLLEFLKYSDGESSKEFEKALTESEKILYKSLKRVVIKGKRGRGVPVLFNRKTLESIECLNTLRKNFSLEDNTYLFGIPGTKNPLNGNAVLRKHGTLALGSKKKAALLTSTKLRKHLATITQVLNMEKNELEQLARFMGHTEKTHSEFYRLPNDIYQTAKISKLLLLSTKDSIEKFKGKCLKDINIDTDIMECESGDEEDICSEELPSASESARAVTQESDSLPDAETTKINAKKRNLVPWTQKQKEVSEQFFKNHIKKRIPPKKGEVMRLIEENGNLFSNKTWPVIKVYICNQFKKK